MSSMSFFLPMEKIPTVTHQQKKVSVVKGKPIFYEDEGLKAARSKFMACLGQKAPKDKFKGPIRLTTWWCFPTTQKKGDGEYKVTKPDTDNLVKLFKDCMTLCGFWKDDAEVASEVIEKYHADIVGIWVKVEEL
ncbi:MULTISPECIES: RusA family crossover junction endodeoxyribonuclease [unclassified Breznakia]|uniref:RusA family crossover junction endodeoxyribonuclease n=1 Tax=unclassified Breznakia TaxID=2623764 RepID=UPI00247352CB|nr:MULTISPECIES: RusA family crossover junction endodeoxyribonuclease [unclassified Breznakia]MDH6367538.1 Holliday junction resolvase RusA-like endonuclease [Breznakia sp. PH1-1]MDH6404668.1 Holliday junction resolvase RusA-like endonuclease [Breznakia sp. PF1-11]MDH6412368.1 Holliday junction resolvase RusA-like endonuclease [Breznakia sp. PFB1-11]MDH6414706.1 Holliday junction resolvase RusA-like endonuclease [Breznakia sp. PFB1-14]MDH6417049.1 Holliday junction resolvase RusA-like endonucl